MRLVFCCVLLVFASAVGGPVDIPSTPRFRQELSRLAEVSLSDVNDLAEGSLDKIAVRNSEIDIADAEFEKMSIRDRVERIAKMKGQFVQYNAAVQAFKKDPEGFGDLFALMDAVARDVERLSTPKDLSEACRVFNAMKTATRLAIAAVALLRDEARRPSLHRANARKVKSQIEEKFIPNCGKYHVDKLYAKDYEKAIARYNLGLKGLEGGHWELSTEVLMDARRDLEVLVLKAMLGDGDDD